jgi:hypothetical protein
MQPVDSSLIPLAVALESDATTPLHNAVSSLLESLTFLLLSPTSRPQSLRRSAAKPVRLLGVWDKSLLASHGKFKLDEADSTIAGLYPLYGALSGLVSGLAASRFDELNDEDRQVKLTLPFLSLSFQSLTLLFPLRPSSVPPSPFKPSLPNSKPFPTRRNSTFPPFNTS